MRSAGTHRSENAGMRRKTGENPVHRKTKVSRGRLVRPGLVGDLRRDRKVYPMDNRLIFLY